ncbi:uncharacterized protein LOC113328687 [Papaver somniferum]|uniref:uncharacterized protein LOC113328687 n=1 Tax=Papaver somniferum TaxID=3469 RepID=UPI000E7013A0|nr:uncharacterized protein LOC113328687 [Papaver somniferum]
MCDIWIGEQSLAIQFPAAYNASASKMNTVNQMYSNSTNSWVLGITRRVQDHVIRDIATLLHLLESNGAIPTTSPDARVWKDGQKTGEFTVKKCYNWLLKENNIEDTQLAHVRPKLLWSKLWPSKVSFFLWSATKNKILTQDQLCRRRWKKTWVNHCYMCISDAETPVHLILHCSVASHIWNFFRAEFKLIWTTPPTIDVAISSWPCPSSKSRKNLVIKALPAAILWFLWKERNRRALNNKTLIIAKIIQKIKHTIAYWLNLQPEFQNSSLKEFTINRERVVFEPP